MVWKKVTKHASILAVVIATLAVQSAAAEQAKKQPVGITVSPAVEQITLRQDQKTATFTTLFTNNTENALLVKVSPRDFTASSDGKQLTFLNNSPSNRHGLSESLLVDMQQFTISPHKDQRVAATIENADGLAPGGHYAALIFDAHGVNNGPDKTVSVHEAVSSIVFINTSGGGTQTTTLGTVPFDTFYTAVPTSVNIVFSNDGNTPTIPRGYAQIIGSRGKLYAQSVINSDSSMILPGSKRLFPITFTQTNGRAFFGIYHLKIFYRHDGQSDYNVYDKKFLLISVPIMFLIGILIVLITGLIFWRFKPKPKSKIVQKAPQRKYMDIIKK